MTFVRKNVNIKSQKKNIRHDLFFLEGIFWIIKGVIIMKGYVLDYINENEYKKLERALKKYNMLAYKKLAFDFYPSFRDGQFKGVVTSKNTSEGIVKYELKLPSDNMFTQVHGDIKLIYTVYKKEQTVMLDTITPTEILLEGHMSELTTYKGIMISNKNASKDKFKIDLLEMLQNK